jgi:ATP-binding cassette, subfamily B, bacterial
MSGRYTDLGLYRRLLLQARPQWPHIGVLFVLELLSTPLALLSPLPLKIAVDSAIGSHPLPGPLDALAGPIARSEPGVLGLAIGLLLLVTLLTQLQHLGAAVLRTYTSEKMVVEFRAQLFRHAQRLSLAYHDAKGSYDSTYRIQTDASAAPYIAIEGVIPFVTAATTLVGMIYVTARIDWQLALIAVAVSPVLFFLSRVYRPRLRHQSRHVRGLESAALSVVQEVLSAIRVVKAFGQEHREEQRFVRGSNEWLKARMRLSFAESGFGVLVSLATSIGLAAVLFVGVQHVRSGWITVGDVLVVVAYVTRLYEPLKTISRKTVSIQSHLARAERAFALLDEAPDVTERPHARPLERASGGVAFRGVSFDYGDRSILQDVTFEIGSGTRVGISGSTGVGKTTLANLLTRFYDPVAGQILLDGIDLRDYKLADLRKQFAIVLQEPVLFSTTIAENIAYARPGASEDEIAAAARAANVHETIMRLPHGYQTKVGERGMRLSGGERQRISLARAFLKDAPILILDEPTSSVDIVTEAAIMEAMERLMNGRTTFMIAHRLSTLEHCDVRLELVEGGHGVTRVSAADAQRVPVGAGAASSDGTRGFFGA